MFNKDVAASKNFALPRPWTAETVSSLAPFDLLFHYTVNTLKPLLGLKAEKKEYTKAINLLNNLGSILWRTAYQLRFNPLVFTHQIKMQLFQILLVNRLPDFPFLLNIFECLHQISLILGQAPLYNEMLSLQLDNNY